jgi:hypothetical protein
MQLHRSTRSRALGLGTVLTTLHTQYESEMKALLNIPETVETAALSNGLGQRLSDIISTIERAGILAL